MGAGHELPYLDDQVHFPDVRIEYQDANGDVRWEDLEVTTEHYRGGHGAAAARSGFAIYTGRGGGGVVRSASGRGVSSMTLPTAARDIGTSIG